jgi:hypothetical protein
LDKSSKSRDIHIRLSNDELKLIKEKMQLHNCENMSAFIRKMAIDGYVINFDIPELDELISLLRRTSNNLNQIAKKVNSTDKIFENEIKEIQNHQSEIWKMTNQVVLLLTKLE